MDDLKTRFDAAVANSKSLPERPDNPTMLRIYGLYKQASIGDNTEPRPGMSDFVGRFKWDAWKKLEGMPREDAMRGYAELIESLA